MLLWWRRSLPESPRWLESRGRLREADEIVTGVEDRFIKRGMTLAPVRQVVLDGPPSPRRSVRGGAWRNIAALWSTRLAGVTAISWAMWFSVAFAYYSFFAWIPSLLVKQGFTITQSFGYSIAIYASQIPGYFSAAFLNERIGRKAVVSSYMLLGALAAVCLALSQAEFEIMAAGMCLSFFMNGAFAGVYAYTPEIFPTAVRTTGVGTSSSFGRIGSVSAPILVGFVYPAFGFAGVFGMTTAVLVVGAAIVFFLGIETRNRSLEDIEKHELAAKPDLDELRGSRRIHG
jgi:putative MFS transporter